MKRHFKNTLKILNKYLINKNIQDQKNLSPPPPQKKKEKERKEKKGKKEGSLVTAYHVAQQ